MPIRIGKTLHTVLTKVLPAAVLLVGLGLLMAWMSGAFATNQIAPGKSATEEETLPEGVETDVVHAVPLEVYEEAVGTLRAAMRTEISSRISAVIERITVRAGDKVKQGDLLIELDQAELQTQLRQAEAAEASARASLASTKDTYERAAAARRTNPNVITDGEFQSMFGAYKTAEAELGRAEQMRRQIEVMLSYTRIVAPRDGTIVDRLAEEGDLAQPGVPLLVLYDPSSLRLEAPVTENLAMKLRDMKAKGETLRVRIDALADGTPMMDATAGTTGEYFQATIDEIVPQAEAASRSFLVKCTLPKSDQLFEGMFGRLMIPTGVRTFLCLNTRAIERIGQLEYVNVVHPPKNTLERRLIKTGRQEHAGRIEVISGLKAGEKVMLLPGPAADSPPGL